MKNTVDGGNLSPKDKYLSRLKAFEKYYLQLIIFAAAAVGVGIVIAVLSNVILGAALVIISACVYIYFADDELKRQLGLRYKNTDGKIIVTRANDMGDRIIIIPSRLLFADVRELGDGALGSEKNAELTEIYLPKSIERIGKELFGSLEISPTIYYEGSLEAFESITTETDLSGFEVVCDCDFPRLPPKQKKQKKQKKNKNGTEAEA